MAEKCSNCKRPISQGASKTWLHVDKLSGRWVRADGPGETGNCALDPLVIEEDIILDVKKGPLKAPEHLEAGAVTYRERNKEYGDSYHEFGNVMHALFPQGIDPEYETTEKEAIQKWNRLGILVQIVSKLTRYSNDFNNPHNDSVHDIMVYASMLMELEGEKE